MTAPFLLAGFYLARMLRQLTRPGGGPAALAPIRYDGQTALEERCARLAYELFPDSAAARRAWWENCARAGDLLEDLMHLPEEYLARIRRCQNPTCQTTFFFKRAHGPRVPRTCSLACRQACFRAHNRSSFPRGAVTSLRFNQKVSGLQSARGPAQSPLFTRPRAR